MKIMSLKPSKWCEHVKIKFGGYLFRNDKRWIEADDWKICPICLKERPEEWDDGR